MRVHRAAVATLLGTALTVATIGVATPANAKAATPTCFGKKATIVVTGRHAVGTKKNDVIVVTNKKGATVNGGAGNDLICGGPGNDVLAGGAGNDKISGGKGNDKIDGGAGNDTLSGGAGDDTITTGAGADVANGDAGNDHITGGPGIQTLNGGAGNDTLTSYQGGVIARAHTLASRSALAGCAETLIGGAGADTATSGVCPVTFIGDALDRIIEKLGDAPVTVQGPVTVVGSTIPAPVDTAALTGVVRGAGSAALGGITVRIVQGSLVVYAVTDTSGHYAFPSTTADGTYSVVANPAGVAGHPQNTAYQASAPQDVFLPHTGSFDITLTPAAPASANTISGLVTDASGPLANVPVTVRQRDSDSFSASVPTDATGRYTVAAVPSGHTYDITANDVFAHVGTYLPRRSVGHKSNVAIPAAGTSVPTFVLTHAATISGVVQDPSSTGLAGAFVAAFDATTQNVGFGTSDATGHYTVGSLTDLGSWALGAYLDQYEPAAPTPFATVSTLDDQVTGTNIVLRHQAPQSGPYYVSGSAVSDATGNGIAVPVTLRDGANQVLDTQSSDATDGSYFMAGTYPAGTYTVVVNDPSSDGFVPAFAHDVQTVTLPANGGNTAQSPDYFGFSSLVASGSLDVLTQDDASTPNPVSGVLVTATDHYGFARSAYTGADGHAVITGLQPDYLTKVTFTKAGYYADEMDSSINVVTASTTNVTVTMSAAVGTISGTVTDATKGATALAGLPVVICPNSVPGGVPASCLSPIATGADGTWTSPQLPAGDYEVTVNFEQYSGYDAGYGADDQIVTVSDTSSPSVSSMLAAAGSIAVTVNAPGGGPQAGAFVMVVLHNAPTDPGYTRSAITDSAGQATITGVPEGSRTVQADYTGPSFGDPTYTGSDVVDVVAGSTASSTITLAPQM